MPLVQMTVNICVRLHMNDEWNSVVVIKAI